MDTILQQVIEISRRHLRSDLADRIITPESSLAELGFDSLAMVAFILELESSLGIQFGDETMVAENFQTVGQAARTSQAAMGGPVEPNRI